MRTQLLRMAFCTGALVVATAETVPAKPVTVPVPLVQNQRQLVLPRTPSEWATVTLLGILTGVFGLGSFRERPNQARHRG
jgi:hypothetical protein